MLHRAKIELRLLAVGLLSVSLSACSPAFFRDRYFPNFRPTPPAATLDAAAVIESTASPSIDANLAEAFRQVMTEDLASLFARTLPQKGSGEEIVIIASVDIQGMLPPTTVTATATLVDPRSGSKLASYTRSARDSTFLGEMRMKQLADQFVRNILPKLKEDLVNGFGSVGITTTRQLSPQGLPGFQVDR